MLLLTCCCCCIRFCVECSEPPKNRGMRCVERDLTPKAKSWDSFRAVNFSVGNCRLTLADHIEEIVVVIVRIQSLHENKIDFL